MLFSVIAAAQNRTEEKVMVDSLVYRQASAVDSALVGKSIFNLLTAHDYGTGDVKIHQSQAITGAMKQHIAKNPARTFDRLQGAHFLRQQQECEGNVGKHHEDVQDELPGSSGIQELPESFLQSGRGRFQDQI